MIGGLQTAKNNAASSHTFSGDANRVSITCMSICSWWLREDRATSHVSMIVFALLLSGNFLVLSIPSCMNSQTLCSSMWLHARRKQGSRAGQKQGRAGQGRQGRAGQGRAGQGRAGQGRAGQGRAGQGRAGQGRAGQGRAGQGRAGQGRAGQ